jgi:hypothetical protein
MRGCGDGRDGCGGGSARWCVAVVLVVRSGGGVAMCGCGDGCDVMVAVLVVRGGS